MNKIILHIYLQNDGFDACTAYVGRGEIEGYVIRPEVAYAKNNDEENKMLEALCELGYLKKDEKDHRYNITYKGLEYAESLLSSNKNSRDVFVAMAFQDDMTTVRDMAIKPACAKYGFNAYTVDESEHNGDITDEIIACIKTSRFVIADFTHNNRGVYFEAGYAQGRGIEVIRTCKKKYFDEQDPNDAESKLHFDINHYNFILWKNEKDLEKQLMDRIRATIL